RLPGGPVRLLPQWHDHDRTGLAEPQSAGDRRTDPGRAALQPVPLRHARGNHAGRHARGKGHAMSHLAQAAPRPELPGLPASTPCLHGVVLRPPYWHYADGAYQGAQLQTLDAQAALQVPGVVACVRKGNFVGVLAVQQEQAQQACSLLDARWATPVGHAGPSLEANAGAGQADGPAQVNEGQRSDLGLEPAWAVAWHDGDTLRVWARTRRPAALMTELQALSGLPAERVIVLDPGHDAAEAYDCAMDAAVMAFGRAQAVQVRAARVEPAIRLAVHDDGRPHAELAEQLQAAHWRLNTLD